MYLCSYSCIYIHIHAFIFIFMYLYSHSCIYIHIHEFIFIFMYLYLYSHSCYIFHIQVFIFTFMSHFHVHGYVMHGSVHSYAWFIFTVRENLNASLQIHIHIKPFYVLTIPDNAFWSGAPVWTASRSSLISRDLIPSITSTIKP